MNKKIFLILTVLIFIAGCTSGTSGCSVGDNCRYYSGSQGVQIYLDYPPTSLFYHEADFLSQDPDGNSINLDVRVRNEGASESYGAVFLTGFGPTFEITRFTDNGEMPVFLDSQSSCTFSMFGAGGGIPFFNFDCQGIGGVSTGPGGTGFTFDFGGLNNAFGWNLPDGVLDMQIQDGKVSLQAAINGVFLETMYHGKILMGMIYENFRFFEFGGMEYTLRGDNPEYPGGSEELKSFRVRMVSSWPSGTDSFDIPYQIKSCYAYTTFISPEICVDPRPQTDEEKVCQSTKTVNLGNQGAPVAVTTMEQINTGRSVQLKFEVRNVGNGVVWDVGRLERCSPYFPQTGTGRANKDVIYIGYVMMEDEILDCNRRSVRLVDGRAEFTCTYNYALSAADIGSAYVTPLRMELWYGYEQLIKRNLRVIRAS